MKSKNYLSLFTAMIGSLGGAFSPLTYADNQPPDPRKAKRRGSRFTHRSRPLSEHAYFTKHGTVYRKYRKPSEAERRATRKAKIAVLKAKHEL